MKLEYGPSAPRGVTTLMAVGDSDPMLAERLRSGMMIAGGVAGIGWLLGVDAAKLGGLGAVVAFWTMRRYI